MEYYNEFKLTMETNAKAKEASEILINRLNKGFEIDNTYRFNPSSKMAQVISANDNTVTLDGYDGYYTVEDSEEVFFELLKVLAENLSEDTFSCEIINNSTYSEGTINASFSNGILTINSVYYPEGYTEYLSSTPPLFAAVNSILEFYLTENLCRPKKQKNLFHQTLNSVRTIEK